MKFTVGLQMVRKKLSGISAKFYELNVQVIRAGTGSQ